eukprot:2521897-Prorocentrum_lima.AAC.1
MSAHTADKERFRPISTTSSMHPMQCNAHVHHSWGEPVPGRQVPYRCMQQENLTDLGLIARNSGNVSWHPLVGVP